MDNEAKKVIINAATQIIFLILGIVLVGIGINFYFAFGLACLLIYHKNHE